MPSFAVVWNRCCSAWRRGETWYLEAVLVSRSIVAGRPQLRLVVAIASLAENQLDDGLAREEFWRRARARLGKLQQLSGRDVEAIERELARRIPKPVAMIAATNFVT